MNAVPDPEEMGQAAAEDIGEAVDEAEAEELWELINEGGFKNKKTSGRARRSTRMAPIPAERPAHCERTDRLLHSLIDKGILKVPVERPTYRGSGMKLFQVLPILCVY